MSGRFWGLIALVVAAAAMRLIPHPPNFTPIAAMALFGGAYFSNRLAAVVLPLLTLVLSDLALGFHSTMPAVYAAFVLVAVLGFILRSDKAAGRIAFASVAGALVFFVVTNFAVWAQGEMYPMTKEGLVTCYVAALPFLWNSLAGDLFFSAVLFGGWALMERKVPSLRQA